MNLTAKAVQEQNLLVKKDSFSNQQTNIRANN